MITMSFVSLYLNMIPGYLMSHISLFVNKC